MRDRWVTITLEFGTSMWDDDLLKEICYRVLAQADRTLTDSAALDPSLPGKYEVTVDDEKIVPPAGHGVRKGTFS
jgi:hypothetical protein